MDKQIPTHQMIEAFRAAVLNGGMSAAADALGTSQSSVSRVIGDLQKLVGFQLFVKQGRTVKPTEEALALMAKVQQSFLGLEDIGRFSEQLRKCWQIPKSRSSTPTWPRTPCPCPLPNSGSS